MAYTPDPTDVTNPLDTVDASTAAAEFRALKGYVSTLVGGVGFASVNIFRKNVIIGGDFDTNPWQRGLNFVGAGNIYTADRWLGQKGGTFVVDVTRTLDVPILGVAYKNRTMDLFARNCFQVNVTTAEAVLGAGDFSYYTQHIEGYDFRSIAQIPLVISFWHKHTKTGIYCVSFGNNGVNRSYIAEYTQAVADTWEYESIPIPATPAAGSWSYDFHIGLSVTFVLGCGATLQTSAGVWTVGNFVASANQVNNLDTIGNKFRLALIQLEAGGIGSKFENRSMQEEMALCQRYYEKTFAQDVAPAQNAGLFVGQLSLRSAVAVANANSLRWSFTTRKRFAPTIVTYNPSVANANWRDTTAGADRTVVVDTVDEGGATITISGVPVAGNLNQIHATAEAEL